MQGRAADPVVWMRAAAGQQNVPVMQCDMSGESTLGERPHLTSLEHGRGVKGIQSVENGVFCSSPLEVLSL